MQQKTVRHFCDVHAHAAAVQHWQQDYSQLTAGTFASALVQLTSGHCHVFRERINQRVVQQGRAPSNRVCFAVPITVTGALRMQGYKADDASLFFLHPSEEFMFHMPAGMDLLGITFEHAFFSQALAQLPRPDAVHALLRQPVIQVPRQRLAYSRWRLLALCGAQTSADKKVAGQLLRPQHIWKDRWADLLENDWEQALLHELLQLLCDPGCHCSHRTACTTTHGFIVEKCHHITLSDTMDAPSVLQLCEQLQVSRRTVQNSFRSVAATTPLHYLRSVRLNGVRCALMRTCGADLSIGDAAAQWGFFHLSHFAKEYQELFGELPSHTARATVL